MHWGREACTEEDTTWELEAKEEEEVMRGACSEGVGYRKETEEGTRRRRGWDEPWQPRDNKPVSPLGDEK